MKSGILGREGEDFHQIAEQEIRKEGEEIGNICFMY